MALVLKILQVNFGEMNKLYLVIVDLYNTEENSIVNICTSRE